MCEFWSLRMPLGKMKFCINKRYNGKARRVLNNQQLKVPCREQRVFKLSFFLHRVNQSILYLQKCLILDRGFFMNFCCRLILSNSAQKNFNSPRILAAQCCFFLTNSLTGTFPVFPLGLQMLSLNFSYRNSLLFFPGHAVYGHVPERGDEDIHPELPGRPSLQ